MEHVAFCGNRGENHHMEAIRIDERTWSIEDGFVRCFLIEGTEKAILVDSGVSGDGARAAAESLTKLPP